MMELTRLMLLRHTNQIEGIPLVLTIINKVRKMAKYQGSEQIRRD